MSSTRTAVVAADKLSTFRIDGQLYGVDAAVVQEVTRGQELTPVPMAPQAVVGLMNLRGDVVTAVDLRSVLGLPARPADEAAMNVVLRGEEGAVSLLVDQIESVEDIARDLFEELPENLTGPGREVLRGAYKLESELLLVVDVSRVIEMETL